MRAICLSTSFLFAAAVLFPSAAQEIDDRVNSVRGDLVRLSFPTRPEICGDGKSISEIRADGSRMHTYWSGGYWSDTERYWNLDCRQGPMRLVIRKDNGSIKELRAAVGVDWLPDAEGVDIGTFSGREVAHWLLDVAERNEHIDGVAFLAANAALDAPIVERLFAMAENESLRHETREKAIRWINRAAEREGALGRADRLLRQLASAGSEHVAVRERAIRSLRKTDDNDAWLREEYESLDRMQLRERVIRRIGESQSSANASWLRSIALSSRERAELRERALRVMGQQTDGSATIRSLYGRLDRPALRERALRVVGEKGSASDMRWIEQVAMDANERTEVRERALRILGEDASLRTLQQLYGNVETSQLKERILRLVGEQKTADGAEWLEDVALDRTEAIQLRDRAIRLLGEYESTEVRALFDRLDNVNLRERALRITAQRNDENTTDWLLGIATSGSYSNTIRDRAVRLLGERRIPTSQLASLYDDLSGYDLRRRVIRVLAERNDEAAVEKIREIAETDPSRDLRRYALRRLAEMRLN